MLNDGSVDNELELWRLVAGAALRNEGAQDGVDNVLVPCLRLGVLIHGGGGDGSVACVGADLTETSSGDGRLVQW